MGFIRRQTDSRITFQCDEPGCQNRLDTTAHSWDEAVISLQKNDWWEVPDGPPHGS